MARQNRPERLTMRDAHRGQVDQPKKLTEERDPYHLKEIVRYYQMSPW